MRKQTFCELKWRKSLPRKSTHAMPSKSKCRLGLKEQKVLTVSLHRACNLLEMAFTRVLVPIKV